jgi:hypothetical protein
MSGTVKDDRLKLVYALIYYAGEATDRKPCSRGPEKCANGFLFKLSCSYKFNCVMNIPRDKNQPPKSNIRWDFAIQLHLQFAKFTLLVIIEFDRY